VAAEASARGDDRAAVRQWKEMAGQLNPDDPDERKWHLLAQRRAEQLENTIHDRRQFVEKQLQLAEEARRSGRPDQAMAILKKLFDEYRKYTDLGDLFPEPPPSGPSQAPGGPPSSAPSEPRPTGPQVESPTPGAKPGAATPTDAQPQPSSPAESPPREDRPQAASDSAATAILPQAANTASANSVVKE
jgi:hypothetical protein